MPARKTTLRAVPDGERPPVRKATRPAAKKAAKADKVPSLLEAVESGDVLDMLLAQRRLIAGALTNAAENTRPQLNNELNKLHGLIREEQMRRKALAAQEEGEAGRGGEVPDEAFDASAV
jgi:hypothetical protein